LNGVAVVGRNVRRMRQERQLSLGDLAREAGLAKQTLSNLEGGTGNPTVETLLAVARALGVGVNWLVTEWGTPVVVRPEATARWEDTETGRRRVLDEIFGSGRVTTAVLQLDEARAQPAAPLPAGTLHHAYVVAGTALAGPSSDPQKLEVGDFIRFPGDVPHVLAAADGSALVHIVTTVPQVQQFVSG
jgi:transcriptional regulator with XRE-family HTH domain